MAAHKQQIDEQTRQRTGKGRRELALHVAIYAATHAVSKAGFYRLAGVRVPVAA